MDARYTRTDFHDGISRYGSSLIDAVVRRAARREGAVRFRVEMLIHDERQLALLPAGVPWHRVGAPTSVAEPLVARRVNALAPDVVFSPMQTMGSFGRCYGLILTLHDLIYYQHRTPPQNLPLPVRLLWRLYHLGYGPQRLLLNRADRVATVSETTAALIRRHRLTRRPVDVVSNAPQAVQAPRDPDRAPDKSLVYMGSFMEYKGVDDLVAAVPLLPGYTLHLLSTITPGRRAELEQALDAARRREGACGGTVVFHGGVSDERYVELLRSATALVTLSRAEGFGLPLAEAMSHGTPVVATDLPIFHEIGGDDGAYLPVDVAEAPATVLAAAVRRLERPDAFAAASRAAARQAERFTWDASADRLLDAAEAVLQARRSVPEQCPPAATTPTAP